MRNDALDFEETTVITETNRQVSQDVPPGPRGVGRLWALVSYMWDPLHFVEQSAREHGDVIGFRMFGMELVQFNHPRDIEDVLRHQHARFAKDYFLKAVREVLGNGLLTSEGDTWRRHRRMIQPAFYSRQIETYADVMVEEAARIADEWQDGKRVDIHAEMSRLTLAIVSRTLFGADVTRHAREVGRVLKIVMDYFADPLHLSRWGRRLPTPSNFRFRAAIRRLDRIVQGMIDERRSGRTKANDLLSRLIAARDEEGTMTDGEVRDELLTLFLAGHETTALAMTYALYLLALHPEVARRLRDENTAVLGTRPPAVADVPRLKFAEAVVKEAMRLYPPAWTIGREAIEDCRIGDTPIRAGTQVILSQWVVHRDARYFPDPERFDPARWLDQRSVGLPRCAYFPFGDGPRICIGAGFAMLEAILLLTTLTQRFRFELEFRERLEMVPSITLRPKRPIGMRLVAAPVLEGMSADLIRRDEPEVGLPPRSSAPA